MQLHIQVVGSFHSASLCGSSDASSACSSCRGPVETRVSGRRRAIVLRVPLRPGLRSRSSVIPV